MSKKAAKKATKTESGAKGKGGHLDATKKSPKDKTQGETQASKTAPKRREAAEEVAHPVKDGKRRVQVTVATAPSETKAARRSKGNIIAVSTVPSREEGHTEVSDAGFANSPFAAGPDDAGAELSHGSEAEGDPKPKKRSSDERSNNAKTKGAAAEGKKTSKQVTHSSKTRGETPGQAQGGGRAAAESEASAKKEAAAADESGEAKKTSRPAKGKGAEKATSRRKPSKTEPPEQQADPDEVNSSQSSPQSVEADGRKRGAKSKSSKTKIAAKTLDSDEEKAGSKEAGEQETMVDPSAEFARERELETAAPSSQAASDVPGDEEDEEDDEASILSLGSEPTEETEEEELSEEEENQRYLKGIIEALLFASDKPLTARELARAARIDKKRTVQLLGELRKEYRHRGVNIIEVSGGFVLRSNPAYGAFVQKALALRPVKLSRAQLETLAIVAYRQPITRPEIDDIRGVDSGQVLKGLADRDLIKMVGKKDEAGRPMLYGTTDAFLELFTLESLKGLPNLREFTELSEDSREKFTQATGEAMSGPTELSDAEIAERDEPTVESGSENEEGEPNGAEPDGIHEGSEFEEAEPIPSSDDVVSAEAVSEDVAAPSDPELDEVALGVQRDAPPPEDEPGKTDVSSVDLEGSASEAAPSRLDTEAVHEGELDASVSGGTDEGWSDVGASDSNDELR